MIRSASDIRAIFNRLFAARYRISMQGGADEPLYLPPAEGRSGTIMHTRDFTASALHEAAHWCLAGARRRRLADYGYPYLPPPRPRPAQAQFFRSERRVQALEALFAEAAGQAFCVSLDDFSIGEARRQVFERMVAMEIRCWRANGLPPRAARLYHALLAVRDGQTSVHELEASAL